MFSFHQQPCLIVMSAIQMMNFTFMAVTFLLNCTKTPEIWSDADNDDVEEILLHTLSRKSLTCFVITKPRGSVVITKPLASQMSLRARKASWLHYMTLYY